MVTVFVGMIAYVIYFMQFKAETVIANSRNVRQDSFAKTVERGDIITSDGVVIATSETDEAGNTNRSYPYSNMFSHLVGYDEYGKAGLELAGNFYMLRSHINIFERVYRELKEEKNRGDNVITTVNYDLQAAAYNALGSCKGAVIAIEPSTGKILCMVSKPDYDPNDIENVWSYLQTEEGSESTILLNRATQGLYPPGSTFKILTTLAFIRQQPVAYKTFDFTCNSQLTVDDVTINCYNGNAHGEENLEGAFTHSCNTAFAQIGLDLDNADFRSMCEEFLFNKSLPTTMQHSTSQFALTADSSYGEQMTTAIGQGDTLVSPLHMVFVAGAIANQGVAMEPYVVDHVENDGGVHVKNYKGKEYGELLSASDAALLQDYMRGVVENGTGKKIERSELYCLWENGFSRV